MGMEQIVSRIVNQAKNQTMTSHALNNYKCDICKDTTWTQGKKGLKRCQCYEMDLVKRLWVNFGINPSDIKLLKEYKPWNDITKKVREVAIDYITSFDDIKNNRENGFCLMGQAGAGKTHIVTAIGKALLDRKIPVVYMPYLEVIRELKACSMDEEYYSKKIDKYKKARVLIIDDLFKDKVKKGKLIGELKETDLKHIYPILNFRYLNYLPTLISTECTAMMLLDLDEALGGRILECCGKRFGVTFKSDCNYRLKKFKE